MAPMRERFCILHFIYYNDSDGTCVNGRIHIYIYMGDKSTSWERAWRSGCTCTVFRDQTVHISIERESEIVYSGERKRPTNACGINPLRGIR